MKKMKRFFALFLAMAMVLGMSITTFAAPGDVTPQVTTVTVNGLHNANSKAGYIRIIEPDPTSRSGWKLTDAVKDLNLGLTLEQILNAAGDTAGQGTINPNLSDLNFNALTIAEDSMTQASESGTIVFSNMGAGLYAIKAVDTTNEYQYGWMVAYVAFDNGVIQPETVTAKGAKGQITKEVVNEEDYSVSAGDEVEYRVTVGYPVFTLNTVNRTFVITDTVKNGTFKADSVSVDEKWGLTANAYAGTSTLTLTLDATKYDSTLAGQEIEITYTVVAGESVSANNPLQNEVDSQVGEDTLTRSVVVIPSVDVDVTKTNASGEAITDSEATFELYKVVEAGTTGATEVVTDNGTVNAVRVGDPQKTINGVATFSGLDAKGTVYYVKETIAPEGYAVEPNAKQLTGASVTAPENPTVTEVNGVRVSTTIYTATNFTDVGFGDGLKFHDSNMSVLPSTGGIGTTIFTVGGCAIMILAAGMFFVSRRRTSR